MIHMLELEDLLSDGDLDVSGDEAAAPATAAAAAPAPSFADDDLGLEVFQGGANKKWSLDDLESCSEDDESDHVAVKAQPPTSTLTTPPKRDATRRQPMAGGLLSPPKALAPSQPAASRVGRIASPLSPASSLSPSPTKPPAAIGNAPVAEKPLSVSSSSTAAAAAAAADATGTGGSSRPAAGSPPAAPKQPLWMELDDDPVSPPQGGLTAAAPKPAAIRPLKPLAVVLPEASAAAEAQAQAAPQAQAQPHPRPHPRPQPPDQPPRR